jgi:cytochrome c
MRKAQAFLLSVIAATLAAETACAERIGDPKEGETLFSQCESCHEIGNGAKDRIGPHLNGVFGRRAAVHEGFPYSKSMARAGNDGLIWTEETLNAYVENPRALVSKTRMSYRGMKDQKDRDSLLAYLRTFSDNPSDIPEAEPTARGTDHDLDPEILALEGDPEYGEYLSNECLTCHQSDGSAEGIPSITNWPTEDFVVAMHAYKRKLRPHPVMQMMAGRLNNEEIAALAAYFKDLEE